jgi:DNA-3-methyladenine glycosylase
MKRDFFTRDTLDVARDLIGCQLIRYLPNNDAPIIVTIHETEAYKGSDDAASHAFRGITPRNRPMFGPPGVLYVYFTYGMHYCMNIVTEPDGVAGAVLLRGAIATQGIDLIRQLRSGKTRPADKQLLNGPAKLTQGLAIDLNLNGYDLFADTSQQTQPLAITLPAADSLPLPIIETPRIGISQATDLPWRFLAVPPRTTRSTH